MSKNDDDDDDAMIGQEYNKLRKRWLILSNYRTSELENHSSLWKRVIAWERIRAASAYGIIWGDAGQEFSVKCHSVNCSGDSKVLTELQIAIRSK